MMIQELEALDGQDQLSVSAREGRLIRDLVKAQKPKILVEVGTGHGYSTAWMQLGMVPKARLITIDHELRTLRNTEWNGVQFVRGTLQEHIDYMPSGIDFLFLDSDHQIQNIVSDLELLESRLSKKAMVLVHDVVYCGEMGRCLEDYFNGIDSARLQAIPVLPSKTSWTYTSHKTEYGLGVATRKAKGTRHD